MKNFNTYKEFVNESMIPTLRDVNKMSKDQLIRIQGILFGRSDQKKILNAIRKRLEQIDESVNEGKVNWDNIAKEVANRLKGGSWPWAIKKGVENINPEVVGSVLIAGGYTTNSGVEKNIGGIVDKVLALVKESVNEKREDVGKFNTVKKVIKELGRRPSEQELATFITKNYYDVTEVERGEDDPAANDKIADLVAFYKFDIDDWNIAWFDATNESVNEAAIDGDRQMITRAIENMAGGRLKVKDIAREIGRAIDQAHISSTMKEFLKYALHIKTN